MMTANLEDALTIDELEQLADLYDPTFRHRSRLPAMGPESAAADRFHERLLSAIRRARFHRLEKMGALLMTDSELRSLLKKPI